MSVAMLARTSETAAPAAKSKPSTDLRIAEPNDAFEQEADRVADEIMSGAVGKHHWSISAIGMSTRMHRKCSCGGSGDGSGECDKCKMKEGQTLQREAAGPSAEPGAAPPIVHEVIRSPGQPLDKATRAFFESRFGWDFSNVRIHADSKAAESARAVNAVAYTVGAELIFGQNQYDPGTASGRALIAHELVHTVQQQDKRQDSSKENASARVQRQVSPGRGSGPLSKIKNVTLDVGSNALNRRTASIEFVHVSVNPPLTATGKAHVSGTDAADYEFGFIQICRPFDIERATYHKKGVPSNVPGQDLIKDASAALRGNEPAVDYTRGKWPWFKGPVKGPDAKVDFDDGPGNAFERSTPLHGDDYDVTGVFHQSLFFTAFAVKTPDGVFHALRTFFWTSGWCEALPAGTDFSRAATSRVVKSDISTCPGCNDSEPGFSKINGPPTDRCVDLSNDAWGKADFAGPGTFSINCGEEKKK